jgi:hypothetical protein
MILPKDGETHQLKTRHVKRSPCNGGLLTAPVHVMGLVRTSENSGFSAIGLTSSVCVCRQQISQGSECRLDLPQHRRSLEVEEVESHKIQIESFERLALTRDTYLAQVLIIYAHWA